jgi:uncharacterized protein
MIPRRLTSEITQLLAAFPAVGLLGPRQVGKTTLARQIAVTRPNSLYLDLENPQDRAKLADPRGYFDQHKRQLVVLDEVQRAPDLFEVMRGVIDERIAEGEPAGQFLLLGSASIDLLKQSSETLAGRLIYRELGPLDVQELGQSSTDQLWVRGGFPRSVLAENDGLSLTWREAFIRTYLERDIPQLGSRIPAETLRRFWTMLAHNQGQLLNAANLARALAIDGKTVARYLDLLVDLLLVRRLQPFHTNVGKRLVRSPKVYVRDSGLVHALLNLETHEDILGHPVSGATWEGLVVETLLSLAPPRASASFYRTTAGAEIDLVLDLGAGERWAIEIKRTTVPKTTSSLTLALQDVKPTRAFVVYTGRERFPMSKSLEAINLYDLATELASRTR